MADTTTRRIIELDVKTSSDALRALKAQQESLARMEKTIKSTEDAMKGFGRNMIAGLTVGAVVGAIKQAIDAFDQLNDRAGQLGTTTTALQEWGWAAQMSGASADEMDAGIRGLSKSMNDMGNATAASTKALKSFGVTANDDVDTSLTKIAEGFSKLQDGPKKTALALDIFGKAGYKLIPMLNEGAEGIAKLKEQAHALGIVMDTSTIKAMAEFNDNLDIIQGKLKGVGNQILQGLMPTLTALVEVIRDSKTSLIDWNAAGKYMGEVIQRLSMMAVGAVGSIKALAQTVLGSVVATNQLRTGNVVGAIRTYKKMWDDVGETLDSTGKKLVEMRDKFETPLKNTPDTLLGSIDSFINGPGKVTTPDFNGGKAPKDKDVEELKRFIQAMKDAVNAVNELSNARRLEILVAEGKIHVQTKEEKQLYETARALALVADERERNIAIGREHAEGIKQWNDEQEKQAEKFKDMSESFKDMADPTRAIVRNMDELQKVIDKTTDPAMLEKLKTLMNVFRGQYTMAVTGATDATQDLRSELQKLGDTLANEIAGFSKDAANSIVEFVTGTKASFSDMVNSILKDFAKLAVKQALDPIFKDFATFVRTAMAASAQGNVFGRSGVQAFASGGVVSGPTYFGMAGGGVGLMGEAGPEAVVPLKRTAGGDLGVQASPVNVTVVNNTGSNIKTEETKGAMGEREILIMVNNAVADGIGRGRFDRVMSTTYGVTRKGR